MIRVLTLLSDFGLTDGYVGVMKGVIAQINSQLQIIDITHQIPPQNITAGRFCLMNSCPYFPPETVHVAVVDPGVGSQRRGVAIAFARGFLVGPDNGLLSGVLDLFPALKVVELTNSKYWRSSHPSLTFHGRDIFASVGAYLASGIPIEDLGKEIHPSTLIQCSIAEYSFTEEGIVGSIQYIDHFGNLITNIPAKILQQKNWSVVIKNLVLSSSKTYSDRPRGEVVALIGSHGWVEIAINGGNAQLKLQVNCGGLVLVKIEN